MDALAVRPGERVLDLAAGTAVVHGAARRDRGHRGGLRLLPRHAAGRAAPARCRWWPATRCALPFADGAFDAVTISFGLRNVADPDAALAELARVTRPGGRLVVCEFSRPTWPPWRVVYTEYLMRALPQVARRVSSNPAAYVYLAESIRAWPDQAALAARIDAAGWTRVGWRDLTGGIVALHRAVRPDRPDRPAGPTGRAEGQALRPPPLESSGCAATEPSLPGLDTR